MKKLLNIILNYFNYELRKISLGHDYSKSSKGKDLKKLLKKTEGMITLEEAELLYNLAKEVSSGCIIEIGAFRGRSTIALAYGSIQGHKAPLYSIEPHEDFQGVLGGQFGAEDRAAFYQAMLDTSCYKTSRLINLSSEVVTPGWDKQVGLLWIDGDHTFEGVKRDFECWEPFLSHEALIAFDDSLNPDLGPKRLIDKLINDKKFELNQKTGKITVLQFIKTN